MQKKKPFQPLSFPLSPNMVNNPNLIPLNTGGINLDVLMNQGFPQLKLEN
jgi:hypothetical protein